MMEALCEHKNLTLIKSNFLDCLTENLIQELMQTFENKDILTNFNHIAIVLDFLI